ncbi:unnamed protein product [Linum tenue]|uniref:Uncharacterized protein n=1 Tax=Linum tenue TaxID=586396 RepID=A0AAV0S773_9ROSI|nr:unnamed protein product [Linum tenue]
MVLLASGIGTDLQSQFWLLLTCSNLMFEIVGGLIRFHQFWLLLTCSNSSSIFLCIMIVFVLLHCTMFG